jgi:O-antigen/teichoic acid export membrane protein
MEFFVQDRISHEQYGLYAALFSLSFIFISLADFGLNLFVTNKIASDQEDSGKIFSNALAYKLLVCILYPFLITGTGYLLGYKGKELWYLLLLGFIQALLQTIYFFRSTFQAKQFFKTDAFASVFDRFVLIIIVGSLLLLNQISLDHFIYSILISSLFTFILFYFVLLRLYGWIAPRLNLSEIGEILKLSFPFALVGILYTINERLDMVMLERLGGSRGDQFAGLYAGAYRWLDAFMMYLWTVLPVFFARFSFYRKNYEEQRKLLKTGSYIVFVPMLFITGAVFFYSEKLFLIFRNSSGEEIEMMGALLRLLVFHGLIQGVFAIYGTWLNANGFEKQVSLMVICSISINFLLNLFLIPFYGPIAAAYATLASSAFIAFAYILFISRKNKIMIPVMTMISLLFISIVYFVLLWFLSMTAIPWIWVIIISGIFLAGFAYFIYRRKGLSDVW